MKARRKLRMKERVVRFLERSSAKDRFTYGEIAKALHTAPMAVGQCLAAIGKEPGMKRLTNRVKALRAA